MSVLLKTQGTDPLDECQNSLLGNLKWKIKQSILPTIKESDRLERNRKRISPDLSSSSSQHTLHTIQYQWGVITGHAYNVNWQVTCYEMYKLSELWTICIIHVSSPFIIKRNICLSSWLEDHENVINKKKIKCIKRKKHLKNKRPSPNKRYYGWGDILFCMQEIFAWFARASPLQIYLAAK